MTTVVATRSRTIRWVLPLIALVLVTAFLLPPLVNINRFRRRIAESIGASVGRPVGMSSVKMRLLPRPGFEIEDFVVEDDPAFGAEPMLRCGQVTAYIRLLSLWRGRLEIARIAFDEPSLNLVRNRAGRWNFDSVLTQAAQIPNAPTAQRHAGGVPRFPYIDASNARVNFKFGDEKMPVSFLNADLAVWLSNPDEWRIQFAAQPARTDLTLDLANTGILRLEGTLRRSPSGPQALTRMPAVLHVEWSNAPLGQLSRIFTGADADWRGQLEVNADISGSADQADLKVVAKGRGIHRAEFEPRETLNVDATCQARFVRANRLLDAITCLVPTGDGHLLLTGSINGAGGKLDPALSLEVNHLPVAQAFDGLRLIRSGFAPEVQAQGAIDGNFVYAPPNQSVVPQLQGQAVVEGLTLAAPAFEKPLTFPALHFVVGENSSERPRRRGQRTVSPSGPHAEASGVELALLLEPFAFGQTAAASAPLNASGTFTRSGFSVRVTGQSHLGQLAALGKEFGLLRNRTVNFGPEGTAEVDVTIHGPWLSPVVDADHPAVPLAVDGSMRLHSAELTSDFLAQPLQISNAQATIGDNRVDWNANAFAYGPIHADGTLSYPVFCSTEPECFRHFTLHVAALDAATAQSALLGATRHGEIVQQVLDRIGGNSHPWPALTGTVQIGALTVEQLTIRDLAASLAIEDNVLQVKSLTGRALAGPASIGALRLSGTMRMTDGTPHYEVEAVLDHAAAPALAAAFQQRWGPGTINLTASLKLAGYEAKQLESSASGTFQGTWAKGALPVEAIASPGKVTPVSADSTQTVNGPPQGAPRNPLARFDAWTADGTIADNTFHFAKSQITVGAESFPLTGTMDFARKLDLAVDATPIPLRVAGTLEKPTVAVAPARP